MVDRRRLANKRKLVSFERLEGLARMILIAGVVTTVLAVVPLPADAADVASAEAPGELGIGAVQEGDGEIGTIAPGDENVDGGFWSEAWAVFPLAYSVIGLYTYWMRSALRSRRAKRNRTWLDPGDTPR